MADARNAPQLWRLLVWGNGSEHEPRIAVEAFRRLHGAGKPHPFDSALLLLTDWRWRRTSARVLAGVLESGLLEDAEQDLLADEFLWQDEVRYVHPSGWFGEAFIEHEMGPSDQTPAPPREIRIDPATPVTNRREVRPPLRTWAARRCLVRRRSSVADVLRRARALPARDGAAVVTGAVHAVGALDAGSVRTVIDAALGWPHQGPRLAALKHLAEHGEADRARALAAGDPNASIRAWAAPSPPDPAGEPTLFD
ncbi:hypothetical protein MF406_04655 [Georgenia sp. TF02-10]|uniref:hypothetical protein n=1 Tax=Georgenia sp. TF02-10 TaxID=2917725 RepID=UPI001FA71E19|nr:hypothetical protein [Georgenia sp. TF02-10]UNX55556.1 hypothetical protein MF406_04655 [Georgenia sp. TF02-10]